MTCYDLDRKEYTDHKFYTKQVRRLARIMNAMRGYLWVCMDCREVARKVHREGLVRYMAVKHVNETGHTVRVLEVK